MKKWILLIVALAGGAWGLQQYRDRKPELASVPPGGRQNTAVAENRNIRFAISAAGDVGPADQVSVRPEINGIINFLPVDTGDRVKKGQVMFALDDQDLQTQKSSKLATIEGAKLQLEKTRRNYERNKRLFDDHLVSQEVYDDAKTDYAMAQNSLDIAQKDLNLVEYQLTKTKIEAPFDCTILTRPVSIGQAVSGSGGFNSGTEVLTIANLNDMIVNAHINQADVTRLVPGAEVDIQIESVSGLAMKGEVSRIAPQTTIVNGIKGYAARIVIKNIDPRIRPGMTASLSIPVATADNVIAVPLASVFTEEGQRFVYVKNDTGFERRVVQVGVTDYDFAEIQKGLQSGEVVALEQPAGENFLKLAKGPPLDRAGALAVARPDLAAGQRPGAAPAKPGDKPADKPSTGSAPAAKTPAPK